MLLPLRHLCNIAIVESGPLNDCQGPYVIFLSQILRSYPNYSVLINLDRNFDLGHAFGLWLDTINYYFVKAAVF